MSAPAVEIPQPHRDALEDAADQAIAACDGDVRAAVRALIIANGVLEEQLREVYATTSRGYARGRVRKRTAEDPGPESRSG
jgi:hypothetical protein